jgi:hypothetical protein
MSEFEYQSVDPINREQLIRDLDSNDAQTVADALYSASRYDEDTMWIEDQCLTRLTSPEVKVRWAAATCLGDLAFSRRSLNIKRVIPALEAATADKSIADPASFSLSMVKQFLGS